MGHPTDDRFDQIIRSFDERIKTASTNPLTDVEKGQMAFWGMSGARVKNLALVKSLEEAMARRESKKLKDVLWRKVWGDAAPGSPAARHIRAAKAEVLEEYDAYTKRLQEAADAKAEIAAQQTRLAAEDRARQKRAEELQKMMISVQTLKNPMQVKRPLTLKNK